MPSSFCWKFRLATLSMVADVSWKWGTTPTVPGSGPLAQSLLCTAPPVLAVYLTVKQSVICHLSLYLLVLSYSGVQRNISLPKLKYKSNRAIYFLKKNRRTHIYYNDWRGCCLFGVQTKCGCVRKLQSKSLLWNTIILDRIMIHIWNYSWIKNLNAQDSKDVLFKTFFFCMKKIVLLWNRVVLSKIILHVFKASGRWVCLLNETVIVNWNHK